MKQLIAGKRPVLEPDAILDANGNQVWPPAKPHTVFHVVVDEPSTRFCVSEDGIWGKTTGGFTPEFMEHMYKTFRPR